MAELKSPRELTRVYVRQVRRLAEQLERGDITVTQWLDRMEALVGGLNIGLTLAAYQVEREEDLTEEAAAVLAAILAFQLGRLRRWAEQLTKLTEAVDLSTVLRRAGQYALAAETTYTHAVVERLGFTLPALPRDKTTECQLGCRCFWRIRQTAPNTYEATWQLGFAEHCVYCKRRAVAWGPLVIVNGVWQNYNPTGLFYRKVA